MRSVLAGLALCLLGGSLAAQRRDPPVDLALQVDAVLEGILEPKDCALGIEQLTSLGTSAMGTILERLGHYSEGHPARKAALLGSVARFSKGDVLATLSTVAREGSEGQRIAALDLLIRLGGRNDLKLVIDLGSTSDPDAVPSGALREATERALLAVVRAEKNAASALGGYYERSPATIQASIVSVLSTVGEGAGGFLAGLLGKGSGASDALVLLALADTASTAGERDLLVLERVRGYIGHPDRKLAVLACVATQKLRDYGAVPDLIVLLGDDDTNVRRAAHTTLVGLTGLSFSDDDEEWVIWLGQELAWWDERADMCRVALVAGAAEEAAAAILEVAKQRLFVQDVVRILALALQRSEPDIVRSACRAFAALPVPAALEALRALARHVDPAVSTHAHAELVRLERKRIPTIRTANLPRTKSRPQ